MSKKWPISDSLSHVTSWRSSQQASLSEGVFGPVITWLQPGVLSHVFVVGLHWVRRKHLLSLYLKAMNMNCLQLESNTHWFWQTTSFSRLWLWFPQYLRLCPGSKDVHCGRGHTGLPPIQASRRPLAEEEAKGWPTYPTRVSGCTGKAVLLYLRCHKDSWN